MLMLLRLSFAIHGGRRLRVAARPILDPAILATLRRQAEQIGLRFAPAALFSGRVLVPTVVGIVRPAIFLPVSLASGLSLDAIEAILAHELAHIRRSDHLLQLVQRLIEAVFFFHPAIWYLSGRIHAERENACDDLAAEVVGKRSDYASALLAAAEVCVLARRTGGTLSLAMADRAGGLRQRITRLIEPATDSRFRLPGVCTATAVLILAVIAAVGLHQHAHAAGPATTMPATAPLVTATPAAAATADSPLPPTFMFHQEDLLCDAAFSPDGKLLATCDNEPRVRLWNTATGQLVKELAPAVKGYPQHSSVVFSPDGSLVADSGPGGFAPIVWDVASGTVKRQVGLDPKENTLAMAISPDSATLALACSEPNQPYGAVVFVDLATGAKRATFNLRSAPQCLAFSHDGKMLACGLAAATDANHIVLTGTAGIFVLDPASGRELFALPGDIWDLLVAFSPDDKLLAVGGRKLWDVASKKELTKAHAPGDPLDFENVLTFTNDGKTVARARLGNGGMPYHNTLRFTDVATGSDTREFTFDTAISMGGMPGGISPLAISADGSMFAAVYGHFVKLWNLNRLPVGGGALQVLGGEVAAPIAPSHDGAALVLEGHEEAVTGLAFSSDSSRLYSVAWDCTIRSWDPTTGMQRFNSPIPRPRDQPFPKLFIVDGGKRVLCGQNLYDGNTGQPIGVMAIPDGARIDEMVFAPGANVGAAPTDQGIVTWHIPPATGSTTINFFPTCMAVSPDGKSIFAHSDFANPAAIMVYDTASGAQIRQLPGEAVRTLSVSPDGKLLAVGTMKMGLWLVNIQTGDFIAKTGRYNTSLVFSPDQKMILGNGDLELLAVPTLEDIGNPNRGVPNLLTQVAISPDGKLVATSDMDRIRVMKLADFIAGKKW
jgi:WD40 repeat protein